MDSQAELAAIPTCVPPDWCPIRATN